MKIIVKTDRGDFTVEDVSNINEARDRIEAEHNGISINQYVEVKEQAAPQQQRQPQGNRR